MQLSDKYLIESYYTAVELKLEKAFIKLLEKELIKRGIDFSRPSKDNQK